METALMMIREQMIKLLQTPILLIHGVICSVLLVNY